MLQFAFTLKHYVCADADEFHCFLMYLNCIQSRLFQTALTDHKMHKKDTPEKKILSLVVTK